MIIELSKLAVADAADATNAAIMSVIQEGGEGASRQVFTSEPVEAVIEDGQRFVDVHDFSISVAGLGNSANYNTLKDFVDNEKEVIVSGYTVDGHVLQGRGYLSYRRGISETYRTDIIELRTRGQYGYDANGDAKFGLMLYTNMFAKYNVLEATGNVMNGFLASNTITESFSSPEQTLEQDSGAAYFESEFFYFPFAGSTLTFSINATDTSIGGDKAVRIRGFSKAGANFPTGSSASTLFSSNGTHSVSFTIPNDGTRFVVCGVNPGALGSSPDPDAITFKHPSLRADGKSEFILQ